MFYLFLDTRIVCIWAADTFKIYQIWPILDILEKDDFYPVLVLTKATHTSKGE